MTDKLKHIGSNLYYSTDEVAIIDYLVDNNLMPERIKKSFVVCNMVGMDLDIIVFNPDESKNKFMHFVFFDFISDLDTLCYLASMFNNFAKEDYSTYKPAQKKLEDVIYMVPTYRALYKYKFNEDTEHFERPYK